jgi:hypothetical protein
VSGLKGVKGVAPKYESGAQQASLPTKYSTDRVVVLVHTPQQALAEFNKPVGTALVFVPDRSIRWLFFVVVALTEPAPGDDARYEVADNADAHDDERVVQFISLSLYRKSCI